MRAFTLKTLSNLRTIFVYMCMICETWSTGNFFGVLTVQETAKILSADKSEHDFSRFCVKYF